jgi:formylglycine-generating enzyme required for sulfatase activity
VLAAALAGYAHSPAAAPPANGFRDCPECPEMIVVPAGRFMMGAAPDLVNRLPSEMPYHEVTIGRPFAIGRFEVTRAMFAGFIRDTGYAIEPGCVYWDAGIQGWKNDPKRSWQSPGFPQTDTHPVVCVPWHAAKAFVEWLSRRTGKSYRLPSEAEWEYAARAGTTTRWYWGEQLAAACEYANLSDLSAKASYAHWITFQCDDRHPYTAPVGSFKPNAFGLHDMIGNAWEWTEDCFHSSYTGAPADGRAWVDEICEKRFTRGTSFYTAPRHSRLTFRLDGPPDYRMVQYGFRVARDYRD